MNRKSAITKSEAAHKLEPLCKPELIAARIAAVLMPPSPDINSSFGSEPCISRRTRSRKDICLPLHVYKVLPLAQQDTPPPNTTNHFCQFRRGHSARRDGPVRSRTGNTTNGVVRSARRKVPKKPMRRSMPQSPVRAQNTIYTK